MKTVTIPQIEEELQKLPAEKLAVVYDFVSFLLEKTNKGNVSEIGNSYETMLASEEVLKRDWERVEEEQAWANL
ncbi:MAG: DUF2281 domain-containing protein [Acidobacteria bacterium]|nr:DUF2281 domain-containing protein [Acidobacteriota bacterium]